MSGPIKRGTETKVGPLIYRSPFPAGGPVTEGVKSSKLSHNMGPLIYRSLIGPPSQNNGPVIGPFIGPLIGPLIGPPSQNIGPFIGPLIGPPIYGHISDPFIGIRVMWDPQY